MLILDLDNTLADTGTHLAAGMSLRQAAQVAAPISGVRACVAGWRASEPAPAAFLLSARPYGLRPRTAAWVAERVPELSDIPVILVPRARDKVRYWRSARQQFERVVIVDDLCHGHEASRPQLYEDLVRTAQQLADEHLGWERIEELKARGCAGTAAACAASTGPEGR